MRFSNGWATAVAVMGFGLASGLILACASDGGDTASQEPAPASSQPAKAAPSKGVAPPAGHPLAKVQLNMQPHEVQAVMGAPTNTKSYVSGKAFIPWNFGADSGSRVEYAYKDQGRVVFAVNRWSGQQKVVRVDYDPNEDGN